MRAAVVVCYLFSIFVFLVSVSISFARFFRSQIVEGPDAALADCRVDELAFGFLTCFSAFVLMHPPLLWTLRRWWRSDAPQDDWVGFFTAFANFHLTLFLILQYIFLRESRSGQCVAALSRYGFYPVYHLVSFFFAAVGLLLYLQGSRLLAFLFAAPLTLYFLIWVLPTL